MRDITRELLKEWAQNLDGALNDIRSRRSSITHADRQQKAIEAANRSFAQKDRALYEVKSYIDVADKILEQEESHDGS